MPFPLRLFFVLLPAVVVAYIPALPTNSSQDAIAGGLNVTDVSKLHMQWYSNGSYSENVSYQLVGAGTTGISKGALVHFSEEKVDESTPPTTTPWIALVACDANATEASMELDIFTLARDHGAVAALLYSLYSLACVINPEYADPHTFDHVFDIFSTQSLTSAHLIEYQFGQLGSSNNTLMGYNSTKLNSSAVAVNNSVAAGYAISPGFLYAVLQAYNATGDVNDGGVTGTGSPNTQDTNQGHANTALAMIMLYTITSCVSALFCIVIISGAIRAIRNPERYGPRARTGDGELLNQSRARGLTRAILDTFPIVKFGSRTREMSPVTVRDESKDVEGAMEMRTVDAEEGERSGTLSEKKLQDHAQDECASMFETTHSLNEPSPQQESRAGPSNASDAYEGLGAALASAPLDDQMVVPESIGRETCPICIVDFEEGDDIRVLPCEGNHSFHQQCVDPWLLELSSSCPICRQDFLALENIISGHSSSSSEDAMQDYDTQRPEPQRSSPSASRFSRYLRLAMHRRPRRHGSEVNPHTPPTPDLVRAAEGARTDTRVRTEYPNETEGSGSRGTITRNRAQDSGVN